MYLKFLGVGAAFNYQTNNNCAYFKVNKTLYVFDMGEKICDKILAMKLLDDVNDIVLLVTHLHSDHIGSLEPFLYWNHFFSKKPVKVFYPLKENLHKLLELTGSILRRSGGIRPSALLGTGPQQNGRGDKIHLGFQTLRL